MSYAKQYSPAKELFTTFELSAKEGYEGQQLNEFQRMCLHNLRADRAEQLLRLEFKADNIVDFAQQNAYLTGQLELLDVLLAQQEQPIDNQE